jgi:RNA polymerase sigma factor (sigma-70 family)
MATVLAPSRADRAFERLYRRYVADVYRYVLAVLQNEADAEDATQTAFLHAYRAYERGERAEKPLNWLIAIAHNVCRQRFRESARRPRLVELEEDNLASRQTDEEETPRAEEIRRALGFLAFNQRAALVMRELQGRSYDEIGRILGLSTSAVETLLFRARRAMREQLEGGLTCGEAELALSKRADGELPFAERGPLRAHLRECAECASLERGQRFRRRAIRGIGLVPLPSSLGSFFGGGAAVGTGGAAAVGSGLGVGAKAAAVVVAGVLGGGVAGDAIKDRQAEKGSAPAARAVPGPAQAKQSPQRTPAVAAGTARTERATPARRRPSPAARTRGRAAPPTTLPTTPPAAPTAAATGASLSAPADAKPAAPPSNNEPGTPTTNVPTPVQAPTAPSAPTTPAPPANPGGLLPGLPSLGLPPPPPPAPPAPPTQLPAPLPALPQPNLPPPPAVAELPKVTVTVTVPGVKLPEVRVQLPPVPPLTKP